MNRITRGIAVLATLSALVLTGCGSSDSDSSKGLPKVEGKPGQAATFVWPKTPAPKKLVRDILSAGKGAEVGADDVLSVNYVGNVWGSNKPFDSSFSRHMPAQFSLNAVVKGWKEGLTGTHVGDRVLLSIPPEDGYGTQGNPAAGIKGTDTIVFVVDVIGAVSPKAAGQADAKPTGAELPVEIVGDLGKPITELKIKAGVKAPTEMKTIVVAEGTGPKVDLAKDKDKQLAFQFAVYSFDGAPVQSTWEIKYPQLLPLKDPNEFAQLFNGHTIGSRLVLEIPALGKRPAGIMVADLVSLL